EEMASILKDFVSDGLLNIVGGCCGTTPVHIKALAAIVEGKSPRAIPKIEPLTRLSGLEPLTISKDSLFVNVGERTNVTGSKKFSKLIVNGKYEDGLSVALQQVEGGAQIIDVNVDEG